MNDPLHGATTAPASPSVHPAGRAEAAVLDATGPLRGRRARAVAAAHGWRSAARAVARPEASGSRSADRPTGAGDVPAPLRGNGGIR